MSTNDLSGPRCWLSTRGEPTRISGAIGYTDRPTFAVAHATFTGHHLRIPSLLNEDGRIHSSQSHRAHNSSVRLLCRGGRSRWVRERLSSVRAVWRIGAASARSLPVTSHGHDASHPSFSLDRLAAHRGNLFHLLRRYDVHAANRVGGVSHSPPPGDAAAPVPDGSLDCDPIFCIGGSDSRKTKGRGGRHRAKLSAGHARERVGVEARCDRSRLRNSLFHLRLFRCVATPGRGGVLRRR